MCFAPLFLFLRLSLCAREKESSPLILCVLFESLPRVTHIDASGLLRWLVKRAGALSLWYCVLFEQGRKRQRIRRKRHEGTNQAEDSRSLGRSVARSVDLVCKHALPSTLLASGRNNATAQRGVAWRGTVRRKRQRRQKACRCCCCSVRVVGSTVIVVDDSSTLTLSITRPVAGC